MTDRSRRNVLMICAHEPTLDPRIHWEAEGAAERFAVTVVGFNTSDMSLPASESKSGYRICRVRAQPGGVAGFARQLAKVVVRAKPAALFVLAAVALPTALVLVPLQLARWCYRGLVRTRLRLHTGIVGAARALFYRQLQVTGVDYVREMLEFQFAPATREFWRFMAELPRKPDVVHCNDLPTLVAGVLAKQMFKCRVVYDAHEFFPHQNPRATWLDRTTFHILEKFLVHQIDAVVTVNHRLASAMAAAYGLKFVYAVPNAEPWSDVPIKPLSTALNSLAAGRTSFLFQGQFSPGRGLEEVIEGWTGVDASRAALFLRGPDNRWRQDLISLAERRGVLNRSVYFPPAVKEEELVGAAAEADVGLIPYKADVKGYELACPNKLSQYLHAGLMVLTNDLPYVREVVEEAAAGLHYDCHRPETLVAAVHRMAQDAGFLRQGQANARRYAKDQFNWQYFSETLYRLYDDPGLAGNAGGRSPDRPEEHMKVA